MRFRSFILWTIFATMFFLSCGPTTEPSIQSQGSTTPGGAETIIFRPSIVADPGVTLVYFLIDHSTPVTSPNDGCGELGKQNVNYVDFVTANILTPSAHENNIDDLFLGIGIFDTTFESVLPPIEMSSVPNNWITDIPESDRNTYYTLGISGALDIMYDNTLSTIQKRILVIITDGFFSNENYETTKASLDQEVLDRKDPSLHISIALLCDKYLDNWRPMEATRNVLVNKLESVTENLINGHLRAFLPAESQMILPDSNKIFVAGHNISTNFVYWTTDPEKSLTMYGDTSLRKRLKSHNFANLRTISRIIAA